MPLELPAIAIELPGVTLGIVRAEGVRVELVAPALAEEMDAVCARIRSRMTVEQVAEQEAVRAVRTMFRAWGIDPSRYRPSSEALLRRVTQGKGLYRVCNVVDVANLGSIESGWPFGLYDVSKLSGAITFRHGRAGESYEGIGRQTWHLDGRPVLADDAGPFGMPISDSTRTMITEAATSILTVLYAPAGSAHGDIERTMTRHAELLTRFTGARETLTGILSR
ncbi:MAG TPA: phenylalanine--tRNA ligase beta subunit-related protein [Candidatus Acidoferrales bacterium]